MSSNNRKLLVNILTANFQNLDKILLLSRRRNINKRILVFRKDQDLIQQAFD